MRTSDKETSSSGRKPKRKLSERDLALVAAFSFLGLAMMISPSLAIQPAAAQSNGNANSCRNFGEEAELVRGECVIITEAGCPDGQEQMTDPADGNDYCVQFAGTDNPDEFGNCPDLAGEINIKSDSGECLIYEILGTPSEGGTTVVGRPGDREPEEGDE